jgi:hypothetical protein
LGAGLQHSHFAAASLEHSQASLSPLTHLQAPLSSLAHLQALPLLQQAQVLSALPDENGHQLGHEHPDIQSASAIPSTYTINNFFISSSCLYLRVSF